MKTTDQPHGVEQFLNNRYCPAICQASCAHKAGSGFLTTEGGVLTSRHNSNSVQKKQDPLPVDRHVLLPEIRNSSF